MFFRCLLRLAPDMVRPGVGSGATCECSSVWPRGHVPAAIVTEALRPTATADSDLRC